MEPFPWKQAIGFGLGRLRLPPEQFWRMTPRELAYAIEAVSGRVAPLDRGAMAQLMKRFPDER
ncbi:MAG: rcc01693 family protein [Pseudolabrys sp.]